MRTTARWGELILVEADFLKLEQEARAGRIDDYRQVPFEAFAWHAWDMLAAERLFPVLLPFLRRQAARACRVQPAMYARRLGEIDLASITTAADWQRLPVLMKDDDPESGLPGFRPEASRDPLILRPLDQPAAGAAFGSGGSRGRYTPTFVTRADREREIQAWRRGHAYHGLEAGDRALYTYNTAHKGGQWMQESLLAHGLEVMLRRPEEGPDRVLQNIRDYQINVLFTVQQPPEALGQQAKAAGINLHSLVMASLEHPEYRGLLIPDDDGQAQVEFIFLGGFEIVPYALELASEYLGCTPIATLLGSSEAIPQACSTNPALTPGAPCHYNHLHLLQSPHYVEVVRREGEAWAPVRKGEQGLLVITSWARDGTLWVRYAPGDVATLLLEEGECPCGLYSPVITNVHRKDLGERQALLLDGCAAG